MALKFDYDNSWIGALRIQNYATGSLPAAGSATKGAVYCDSTANTLVFDNGTSLLTISTSSNGLTGTLTSGRIPYTTGTTTLADSANFLWDNTNSIQTITGRITVTAGSLATSGFSAATITATLNASANTETGISETITSAGTGTVTKSARNITFSAGYTSAGTSVIENLTNSVAGTGASLKLNSAGTIPLGNISTYGLTNASTAGRNMGLVGEASASTTQNIGIIGKSLSTVNSGTNIGVIGSAVNAGTSPVIVGGYFTVSPNTDNPTFTSAALIADNGNSTVPIFLARANGTTTITINSAGSYSQVAGTVTTGTNAFTLTATQASSSVAETAISETVTSAGNSVVTKTAYALTFAAGYSDLGTAVAQNITNSVAGHGASLKLNSAGTIPLGNISTYGFTNASTVGYNIGLIGEASASTTQNIGIIGKSLSTVNSGTNIGVIGSAVNAGTSPVIVGGYFTVSPNTDNPTFTSAALIADNGNSSVPVFLARVNGTTKVTIDSSGNLLVTGLNSPGAVLYSGASGQVSQSAAGTTGQVLLSGGTASPTWTNAPTTTKNRAINGGMITDQRNEGNTVTATTTAKYPVDRFFLINANGTGAFTGVQSTTAPAGFSNSLLMTVTTADATLASTADYYVAQKIEGNNVYDFNLGTANAISFTLSFWVRSSVTGTFGGVFRNSAASRHYPFTYVINSANTFEQKTVTLTGDTTGTWLGSNNTGLWLILSLGTDTAKRGTAGTWSATTFSSATGTTQLISTLSATFYLTGVQIEPGSVATAWDFRSFGLEKALCQRYYSKCFNDGVAPAQNLGNSAGVLWTLSSGTNINSMIQFPVSMRAAPSITTYCPSATTTNWSSAIGAGVGSISTLTAELFNNSGTVVTSTFYSIYWSADAEL